MFFHNAACLCLALASAATATAAPPQYKIVFDNALDGGSFYRTRSLNEGQYYIYTSGQTYLRVQPGDGADIDRVPSDLFTDNNQPIGTSQSVQGKLKTFGLPFLAGNGRRVDSFFRHTVGTARQNFNIGGTYKIVPVGNAPANGTVAVKVQGIIDGWLNTGTHPFLGAPSADFSATIDLEKIGTASARRTLNGTSTTTVGVEGSFTASADPSAGAKGTASHSVQKLAETGTGVNNFSATARLPINQSLTWNFTMNLEGTNTNFLTDCTAATSKLTDQWVTLSLVKDSFVAAQARTARNGPSDARYSQSATSFSYSPSLGVQIAHPDVSIGNDVGLSSIENDTPNSPPTVNYGNLRPELDFIADDFDFYPADPLRGANMTFGSLLPTQFFPDGKVEFGDSTIVFRSEFGSTLATANIRNLLADPLEERFSGRIDDFAIVNPVVASSIFGQQLAAFGGEIDFDPELMAVTQNFTLPAQVPAGYSMVIQAIPEPSAGVLLAIALFACQPLRTRRRTTLGP